MTLINPNSMVIMSKEDIIPAVKQAIKEMQTPVKHPIEWITPKQSMEYLGCKSPITLNRIIEREKIRIRYRKDHKEVFLPDLVAYKESLSM